MEKLITFGLTLDLVADVASMWAESGEGLATTLMLGLLPAAAAFYRYVTPATESNPAEFRAEPIRR